jgi:uncharacterized protein (UPF0276 family)
MSDSTSSKPENTFLACLRVLPKLGFGIGLKDGYTPDLLAHRKSIASLGATDSGRIDWLEIIPENYMNRGGYAALALKQLQEAGFPMVSHGVNLSIGSVDPFDNAYLDALAALFETVQPVWFSDHLCFTSVNGRYFNDLLPLPFSREAVDHCVERIRRIQAHFRIPFLIENISYYAVFSQDEGLSEAAFLSEIVRRADCGLLLDVNNVYVNARNHGYDPLAFVEQLPLERVVEIHMAGHLETDTLIIDTHGEPVCADVFALLARVYPKCENLKGVLLERDTNLPPFETLRDELQAVRQTALSFTDRASQTVRHASLSFADRAPLPVLPGKRP